MKVLIIDDDEGVRNFVSAVLRKEGMDYLAAAGAVEAREILAENRRFDAILLDVTMPGASGWDFLDSLRATGDDTPVIFVTGRQSLEERVKGLRLGADDYITKPFDSSELLARLEAVVRRGKSLPILEVGDLRVDLGRRIVERGENRVDLSPREFDLLRALVEGDGETLSRTELLSGVWGLDFDPGTKVVEVHVARLRRKLERSGPSMIVTEVGKGYRIAASEAKRP